MRPGKGQAENVVPGQAEQADRCRDILGQLSRSREAEDIVHANMPLSSLVEEAAAPFKGLGVTLNVTWSAGERGEARTPLIRRSPEVLHALGAFDGRLSGVEETQRRRKRWS